MTKEPAEFEILDKDSNYIILDLGVMEFEYEGDKWVFSVDLEAFVKEKETEVYDYEGADIHLHRQDGEERSLMDEFTPMSLACNALEDALRAYLIKTIDGNSEGVCIGESGAQSEDMLSFDRNGWWV